VLLLQFVQVVRLPVAQLHFCATLAVPANGTLLKLVQHSVGSALHMLYHKAGARRVWLCVSQCAPCVLCPEVPLAANHCWLISTSSHMMVLDTRTPSHDSSSCSAALGWLTASHMNHCATVALKSRTGAIQHGYYGTCSSCLLHPGHRIWTHHPTPTPYKPLPASV